MWTLTKAATISSITHAVIFGGFSPVFLAVACQADKAPAPKPCCEQPSSDMLAGVTPFVVTADDTSGPSDGQKAAIRAALKQPARRDEVYPVLHALYRHAMKRGPFEPIQFVAEVYPSESAARAGGDAAFVARIVRNQGAIGPTCDNRVPYDFSEQAQRAFASLTGRAEAADPDDTCRLGDKKKVVRHDDAFTHKPALEVDPAARTVTITLPFLASGKDEYAAQLRLSSALREWIDAVATMFRKVDRLQQVSFVGLHKDAKALEILVTREQFDANLSSLQEEIAAHASVTFQNLGMKQMTDKEAEKDQAAFHTKTYKAALATLPKGQVSVSSKLK